MKKTLSLIVFVLIALISCNQKKNVFHAEDFRTAGMSDYDLITTVYNKVPDSSTVIFANRTYTFDHALCMYKAIYIQGSDSTIFKRENQVTYTLKEVASDTSNYFILNDVSGLRAQIHEHLFIALDTTYTGATLINEIVNISGDTVFMGGKIGATVSGVTSFPVGTKLYKSVYFFGIADDRPNRNCSFTNLTFDGNRDNNRGSDTWYYNYAIIAPIFSTTTYRNCTFINSPAETIVGHNADIQYCKFLNLNGSAFHTSADKVVSPESTIHSIFSHNSVENTNRVPVTINGHDEGAITHSNSGGYYTAQYNTFKNVGYAVLGYLYQSLHIHDWGTSNITFTNNTIDSKDSRMVYNIDTRPGIIHDVVIKNNNIINLTKIDFSAQLAYWKGGIILEQ